MADWPNTAFFFPPLGVIATGSKCSSWGHYADAGFTAGGTWPAANRAIYMPFYLDVQVTVFQIGLIVAVQSGNLDVGIYAEDLSRVVSKGSTAVAAAGVQLVDITDTTLNPGTYWMGMCCDNTTASFNRSTAPDNVTMRVLGVAEQAVGSVTLPDPASFSTPSSAYVPLLSLTTNATA